MSSSFADLERHRFLSSRLVEELSRRRLPVEGGWGHCSAQFGTEATSLALLSLCSSPAGSFAMKKDLPTLLARRRPNGTWPATVDGAGESIWATALAANTLMYVHAKPAMIAPSLDALVQSRPLEASWLVRLKFRFSDRQVRFDPTKYGWPWVPNTVSWVLPTSMALIALERAKRRGLVGGKEVETRLRLGAEMLLDRACVGGGWNAGNAVVYGVPLRPHIDATAIALAALRLQLPESDSARLVDLAPGSRRLPVGVQLGMVNSRGRRIPGRESGCHASTDRSVRSSRCSR